MRWKAHLLGATRQDAAAQQRQPRLLLAVQLLYLAAFTVWLLVSHTWPAPDVVMAGLLLCAVLSARGLRFLRDWTPFLLLLLAYVGLTGLVPGLATRAHIGFPIAADRALFGGQVPTVWLQAHFYQTGHPHWYDYGATLLYPMHFVVPLLLAYVFWHWRPQYFRRFVIAYLLLCYAGFLTYLIYPMAPPWWAYRYHRLPPVHLILYEVHYGRLANPVASAAQFFRANPVAAMPSLHAAFPVLVWLVLWRVWPKWGWAVVVYPLAMSWAVVYLGEHYVIDCLAGAGYALAAFGTVWGAPAGWGRLRRRPRRPALHHAGPR